MIVLIISARACFKENTADSPWIKDLGYEKNQIYDISLGFFNSCPSIVTKIGDKEVKLLFDTGNGEGLFITSALEGKIDYEIKGTTTELNADGTYRGTGKSVLLEKINVFGEEYTNITASLSDWKMYGDIKINGGIGLKYFEGKKVTLDYKNKRIAVSSKATAYDKLPKEKYTVLPLVESSLSKEKDLLFFEGKVNGEKSTIYLDTGSSRSFFNLEDTGKIINVKLGAKTYQFGSKEMKKGEIGFPDEFAYPLRLAINSDILKANHFVITIDLIQNNLILYQN